MNIRRLYDLNFLRIKKLIKKEGMKKIRRWYDLNPLKIKEIIKEKRITKEMLAKRGLLKACEIITQDLNINKEHLNKLSPDDLESLAKILEITIDELIYPWEETTNLLAKNKCQVFLPCRKDRMNYAIETLRLIEELIYPRALYLPWEKDQDIDKYLRVSYAIETLRLIIKNDKWNRRDIEQALYVIDQFIEEEKKKPFYKLPKPDQEFVLYMAKKILLFENEIGKRDNKEGNDLSSNLNIIFGIINNWIFPKYSKEEHIGLMCLAFVKGQEIANIHNSKGEGGKKATVIARMFGNINGTKFNKKEEEKICCDLEIVGSLESFIKEAKEDFFSGKDGQALEMYVDSQRDTIKYFFLPARILPVKNLERLMGSGALVGWYLAATKFREIKEKLFEANTEKSAIEICSAIVNTAKNQKNLNRAAKKNIESAYSYTIDRIQNNYTDTSFTWNDTPWQKAGLAFWLT